MSNAPERALRSALVTGGASGIGKSVVAALSANGYRCVFTYRASENAANEVAEATGATAFHLDLREDPNNLPPGDFDIVVNNAAVNLSGSDAMRTSLQEMRETFDVNVLGALATVQRYAPAMVERSWGRIININSIWGLGVAAQRLSYACSKHALRALTQTVALEMAHTGVTVNEIAPGPVDTPMLRRMGARMISESAVATVDEYLSSVALAVPTGRLIDAQGIASSVLFLADDVSSDISGQTLGVTGGAEL